MASEAACPSDVLKLRRSRAKAVNPALPQPPLWPRCHAVPTRTCPQCRFALYAQQWTNTNGSHLVSISGRRIRVVWLAERPPKLPGSWALGCVLCAAIAQKFGDLKTEGRPLPHRTCSTKWARYEVRGLPSMQSENLKKHAASGIHLAALRFFLEPTLPGLSILPDTDEDAELLRGHVPQLEHWLRAWRFARTPTSYRASEALQRTEAFVAQARPSAEKLEIASRKALSSVIRILAEVTREAKRAILKASCCMSISLDDRKSYRLIRFRCFVWDTAQLSATLRKCGVAHPSASVRAEAHDSSTASNMIGSKPVGVCASSSLSQPAGVSAVAVPSPMPADDMLSLLGVRGLDGVYTGVLCVLEQGGDGSTLSLNDVDRDHSEAMAKSVLHAIGQFCTPLGQARDEDLFAHIRDSIATYTADGGSSVVKCGALLQAQLPGLRLLVRDTAHMLRSTCNDPLTHVEVFADFWSDIFDARHALLPDLQNSEAWKAKLVMAQRHVLSSRGHMGGGIRVALRHLSFAKQRFDSAACPARKFCCLLSAIAITLAVVAEDHPLSKEVRHRAAMQLDKLTPERIVAAGLFADFSAEVLSFVRCVDASEHDFANLYRQADVFLKRLRRLLFDGLVLEESPAGWPVGAETCTVAGVRQAMHFGSQCECMRALYTPDLAMRLMVESIAARLRVHLGPLQCAHAVLVLCSTVLGIPAKVTR